MLNLCHSRTSAGWAKCIPLVLCLALVLTKDARAQSFSSGSTGTDGALSYTTPGTYTFNPKSFSPPLNPKGDNIFDFTTINIVSGVTVRLDSRIFTGPVYWLASGDVTIAGTIDVSGSPGTPASSFASNS